MASNYLQSVHIPVVVSLLSVAVIIATTVLHFYNEWMRKQQLQALPVAELKNDDWKEALFRASAQYPNTPFVLQTGSRPRVILPNSTMDEIRLLPEDQVSLRKDLYEKMFGRWTEVGTAHTTGIDAIRKELTVNIAQLLPEMQDEVKYALDKEIGSCPDWTRITLLPHLMQLSALTNGRFFVGPLCRDQNWINLSLSYSVNIMGSVKTLQTYNKIVRPLVAPFLPQLRKLDQHKTQADHMLRPYIAAALDARKVKTADGKEAGSELHLISWMLNHVDTAKKIDTNMLAREQLFIGSGSIHAIAVAVANILYDLASNPEYIPELRAEISEVLATEPEQKMRKTSLPKLRKLDSLLLESQRMNPVSLTSIHRRVTARNGLRLSTGHIIPYDTSIAFLHPYAPFSTPPPDLIASNTDKEQPPLTSFYPFRFSELRSLPGEDGHHQFTQTGRANINFGHGPASCPGRWFASSEIKCIVVEILERYDVALGPNGEGEGPVNGKDKKGASYMRPQATVLPGSLQNMPDFTAAIYFKDRAKNVTV